MADNRMWLAHKETGWATCIAKRFDHWYMVDPAGTGEEMQRWFDLVERRGTIANDDFCLLHENDGHPWRITMPEPGRYRVEWPGEIPTYEES